MRRLVAIVALCALVVPLTAHAAVQDEIAALQQKQTQLQAQLDAAQEQLTQASTQKQSLQTEISKLNAQISVLSTQIQSLQASIDETGLEIGQTQTAIENAEQQISVHQQALASALRETAQNDLQPLSMILLQSGTLSDFFDRVHDIQRTQDSLSTAIQSISDLRDQLDQQQSQLQDQQTSLEQAQALQEAQQRQLATTKTDKNQLLKVTQGQESKYQQLVATTKTNLQRLQEQIYYLQQNGVSAEDAIKYGQLAAIGAGIRPEFLIAELEQESALGANVGKCYIVDSTSGETRRITNGQIYTYGINPTRDLPYFLSITAQLNRDPFQTPISCGSKWGGAMGAAQFLPSTWMGYRDQIAAISGHALPDPWNIEDAFVAAAAKLSNDGASSQTRAGEIAASKKYYCGNAASTNASCVNYANSVQLLAANIKSDL
ncbi:MAG TPA: lytic murein transglycosylase [Candidatus Paceibacterota bacterium]|nr:lytic murein transglycosylase [Candidatus Paceibacterota bacterium]